MVHIAYLDEFGHIGPYVSPTDRRYNTHPVFGFGGYVLPAESVREFGAFFLKLRNNLLRDEIVAKGVDTHVWEKKGSALLTTRNVVKYPELRVAINRLLGRLGEMGGYIPIYGQVKPVGPPHPTSEASRDRYQHCLVQLITRQSWSTPPDGRVLMILDEIDDKSRVEAIAMLRGFMFSKPAGRKLLEPPMQVESHLYPTVQAADWICALISRITAYQTDPTGWAEFEWAEKYFSARLGELVMLKSKVYDPSGTHPAITRASLRVAGARWTAAMSR